MSAMGRTKHSGSVRSLAAIITKGFFLGLLAVSFIPHQVAAADNDAQLSNPSSSLSEHKVTVALLTPETQPVVAADRKRANFEREHKSRDAQHMADWVVDSGDNRGMPFVIVDKKDAKVFVFYVDGRLRGAAPTLLGMGVGDDAIPGIGDREMSTLRPEERTTPAGRFVSYLGCQLLRKGYSLGRLRRCRFHASGGYEQARGASPGAFGNTYASRQPYFLWLHQCTSKFL